MDFYGIDKPKGWTSADGKTTVNLSGLPDIREFLNVEIHEALHSATHQEIINAGIEAIDKHKADLTNVDNYRFSERGTIMKRPAFNEWLDKVKKDIGATIAFHEISSFLGNKIEGDRNYNRNVTSAIDYTPQFIDDAGDLWRWVLRYMRATSIKASGVEKNPFGKRLPKLKEYKDIFSRVVGYSASQIFVDVLANNKDWSDSTQRSLDAQTTESIQEVRERNFKKSLIRKVYTDKDITDLYIETHQYLRITSQLLGFDFGERSQSYTLAGLMTIVSQAVKGQEIDLEKQFMRLDDVIYDWPKVENAKASKMFDSLYRMLKFRQENA